MPDFGDLKALPELVQVWGGLWLFITGGIFWMLPKVLAIDSTHLKEAENAATSETWRINDFIRRKAIRTDMIGSDYLTDVSDLRELRSIILTCTQPLTSWSECRKYTDWVKGALGLHAVAWAVWVALILFTETNETAIGVPLFVLPLALVLFCGVKATLLRNALS